MIREEYTRPIRAVIAAVLAVGLGVLLWPDSDPQQLSFNPVSAPETTTTTLAPPTTTTTVAPTTTAPPTTVRVRPRPTRKAAASRSARPSGACTTGSSNRYVSDPCRCEGQPGSVSANGKYYGKYQFDRGTWNAHAKKDDPATPEDEGDGEWGSATEQQQDRVAARVTYDAWPNC